MVMPMTGRPSTLHSFSLTLPLSQNAFCPSSYHLDGHSAMKAEVSGSANVVLLTLLFRQKIQYQFSNALFPLVIYWSFFILFLTRLVIAATPVNIASAI